MTSPFRHRRPLQHLLVCGSLLATIFVSGEAAARSLEGQNSELARTRAAVAAVKNAIVDGHRTRNALSLDTLYLDSYTASDPSGRVRTKGELLAGLATDPEMIEGRYELITVRQWRDIAVASGRGRMTYRNADGSTRVSEYNSVNVFERVNGAWRYAAAFLP